MDTTHKGDSFPSNEWLFHEDDQINAAPDRTNADTEGYGTDPGERAYFASGRALDDKDRENQEEDDATDWGNPDPLDPPGDLPDPMDPSGPGSAV